MAALPAGFAVAGPKFNYSAATHVRNRLETIHRFRVSKARDRLLFVTLDITVFKVESSL